MSVVADAYQREDAIAEAAENKNGAIDQNRVQGEFTKVRGRCRELLLPLATQKHLIVDRDIHDWLKSITNSAFESQGATTAEQKLEWLQDWEGFTKGFIADAENLGRKFDEQLRSAQTNGWISKESAARWRDKLKNHSASWTETKRSLEEFDHRYYRNWQVLGSDSEQVKRLRKQLKDTPTGLKELAEFESKEFLNKPYEHKRKVVDALLAKLPGLAEGDTRKQELARKAVKQLDNAVARGVYPRHKVRKWMVSVFEKKRSLPELEHIVSSVLPEYIGRWAQVRDRYDWVMTTMAKEGVPMGLKTYDEKAFLDLDWEKRMSHVEEAERSIAAAKRGPSKRPVDDCISSIRGEIGQEDWDEAEFLLGMAKKLAETDEDWSELCSIEWHIRQHRPTENKKKEKQKEGQSTQEIYEEIDAAIDMVPGGEVKNLYRQVISLGDYDMYRSFAREIYNRKWCYDHGYLNAQREEKLEQSSLGDTQEVLKNGHRTKGLENLNMSGIDSPDKQHALQRYSGSEGVWAPTIIHMNAADGAARTRLIQSLRTKNEARDYWSTLIIKDMSIDKNNYLVSDVNWRIKSGMRKLQERGERYVPRHMRSGTVAKAA